MQSRLDRVDAEHAPNDHDRSVYKGPNTARTTEPPKATDPSRPAAH
jgi:hypothetical protein